MNKFLAACVLVSALTAQGGLVGVLSTAADGELVSGGKTWLTGGEGLTVNWAVSQNSDGSWHYRYEFANGGGEGLLKAVNHFILSASDHISSDDVFGFSDSIEEWELGVFGAGASNPSLPSAEFFGLKIGLYEEQASAEFDSLRQPMWGDIYLKGGGNPKNYGYNADFGIETVNPHGYLDAPVDALGRPLFKVLVPDALPESATLVILGTGLLFTRYK